MSLTFGPYAQLMPTNLSLNDVEALAIAVLRASGASQLQAESTGRSIRDAEADGIHNVGLGYLPIYADHVACGKVNGSAVPEVRTVRPVVVGVDAHHGFAHPAFAAGLPSLVDATRTCGIATMAVSHSYSAGVVGWFVEAVANHGLVALMFANSSAVMAPTPIPPTWALDTDGDPTTDAALGIAGTVAPAGGHKGSALALLVDLLAGGLTGSSFSHEASSFGDNSGRARRCWTANRRNRSRSHCRRWWGHDFC